MGTLWFVVASGALAVLARRLAARLVPGASISLHLLATLVLFVALVEGVLLGLGLAGLLAPGPIAVASAVLLGAELVASARGGARPLETAGAGEPAGLSARVASVLLAGVLAWWAGRTVGSGTGYVWDDLAYHAAIPAWWARAGTLELVPLTYQSYYPASAELFALWFVVPFPTDALANASVLAWMALVVAACAALAREHELAPLPVALALACFAFSPEIGFFAGTFSANDLAVAGLGTAMLALAAPGGGAGARGRAFLAGLAGGLALGTKVSVAPQLLLVSVWLGSSRFGAGAGRRGVAVFLAGALLGGGAWYARNLVLTGNPFYPAELGPLAGPFSAEAQRKTSLVPAIAAGWTQASFWLEFLRRRLDWPLALGLVSLLGYAVGLATALRGEHGARRRHLLLLAGAGLLFLALFPLQPFSGTNNRPTTGPNNLIRYLAWPFLLGLVLFARLARHGSSGQTIAATLALGLALVAARPGLDEKGAWLFAGLAAGAVLALAAPRATRSLPALGAAVPVLLFAALALRAEPREHAGAARMYSFGDGRPIGAAWRALEELPAGARIAALTNDPASHGMYRPLFGRRAHLEPVAVDASGRRELPLHERRAGPSAWWEGFEPAPAVTLAELRANLRAARIDFLLVSKWPRWPGPDRKSPWPRVHDVLGGLEPSRRVFADGYAELWDLREAGVAGGGSEDLGGSRPGR